MISEEILVNASPTETRVALVENGMLQEVFIERTQRRGYVGNIYKGKVIRVLPGMQAAFVDIGLERAGFIHAADIAQYDESGMEDRDAETLDIRSMIREGQPLVVQVTKDPISAKGARLTTHLSVSGRFLVYMPQTQHIGVSTRIEQDDERARLRSAIEDYLASPPAADGLGAEGETLRGGFIVRTVAEGVAAEDLCADIPYLYRLWQQLERRIKDDPPGKAVYEDLPLSLRALRDHSRPSIERIRVDSREFYGKMMEFSELYTPSVSPLIEHYPGERPLFDLYGIEEEIQKALENSGSAQIRWLSDYRAD